MGQTVKELVVKIKGDNKQVKGALKQTDQNIKRLQGSVKKLGIAFGAAFATTKIVSFFKKSVELYGIQEKAERKLADSIKATSGNVKELLPRYLQLAKNIQKVTTVGDETTIEMISLAKQMQVADSSMEKAIKGAIGLSKAFGIDLNTSMKMVAAGIKGDTTLLNRYLPQLRGVTDQTEKMKILNDAMSSGWKVATGEAKTFTGKMEQLSNTLGDVQEGIGKALAEAALPLLKDLSTWVSENSDGIITFFKNLGKVIEFSFSGLRLVITYTQALSTFAETKKKIKDINFNEMQSYLQLRAELEKYGASFYDIDDAMKDFRFASDGTRNSLYAQLVQVRRNIKEYPKLVEANKKLTKAHKKEQVSLSKLSKTTKKNTEVVKDATKAKLKWINIPYPKVEPIKKLEKAHEDLVDVGLIPASEAAKKLDDAFKDKNARSQYILDLEKARKKADELKTAFGRLADMATFMSGIAKGKMSAALSGVSNILSNMASGNVLGAMLSGFDALINVFSDQTEHMWDMSAATDNLNDMFKQLGMIVDEDSQIFQDFLNQMKDANLDSSGMLGFSSQVLDNLGILDDQMSIYISQHLPEFQNQIKDATKGLNDFFKLGINNQTDFNAAMNITLGSFAKMISYGMNFSEAISAMGDNFATLKDSMEKFGFESNESFDALMQYSDFISVNKDLIAGINGLNDAFNTMAEVGMINTQSAFDDWSTSAESAIQKLKDSGADESEILLSMAPMLKNLKELSEKFGFAIDEDMQKWIDLGDERGLFDQMDPMEEMVDILKKIAIALGVIFDEATNATGAIGSLGSSLRGVDIGTTSVPGTNKGLPGFASGGDFFVDRPTPILVGEKGAEHVVITPQSDTGGAVNSGSGQLSSLNIKMVLPNITNATSGKILVSNFVKELRKNTMNIKGELNKATG